MPSGEHPQRSWRPSGIVTLLTDFGAADPYVAVMKGVLLSEAPELRAVVDLSHEVAPQDVQAAALFLEAAWSWFPAGTVHVVVVDPEVGTERALLLVECGGQAILAPDNGAIGPLVAGAHDACVRRVGAGAPRVGASATFDGRDRLAPLAARLASGTAPDTVGDVFDGWRRLDVPAAAVAPDGSLCAEIVLVDRFGNLITSARREQLAGAQWSCEVGGRRVAFARTYAAVAPGELVCLVDSYDRIEVAVRDGDAARELGLGRGAEVRLVRAEAAGESV